jgi:uncharacterized BrkB/YihY/UPF0761 family membrane protein
MRVPALRVANIIELGERLIRNYSEHRMATYAAALAYRGLFALLPFMLILVVLAGALGSPDSFDRLLEEARTRSSQQVPQQLLQVVEQGKEQIRPLEEIVGQAQKQAGGNYSSLALPLRCGPSRLLRVSLPTPSIQHTR